jgi:hypothetical protein
MMTALEISIDNDDDYDEMAEMEMLSLLSSHHDDNDDDNDEILNQRVEWMTRPHNNRMNVRGCKIVCRLMVAMVFAAFCLGLLLSVRHKLQSKGLHNSNNNNNDNNNKLPPCDCFDVAARCCDRTVFRTHKFGTILLGDMFLPNRLKDAQFRIHTSPTPKNYDYQLPTTFDYRHVLVTRNWFDAMVSGYLYHQAGYECTMDYKGNASATFQHHSQYFNMEQHYHLADWDAQLTYHHQDGLVVPRHNRSFCQYLQDEPMEIGMPVLMDFALSRWYKGVVPYYEKAKARDQQTGRQRSLFLCFEDLVNPYQQEDLFHQMATFLFPSTNASEWTLPGAIQASIAQQKASHGQYEGGHATNHDAALRQTLRQFAEQLDRDVFGNVVATSSAMFGCGEKDDKDGEWS